MGRKKQHQVLIYEKQYDDLKEYCEENYEIMVGVVSRLVRQFIERVDAKELAKIEKNIGMKAYNDHIERREKNKKENLIERIKSQRKTK